MTLSIRTPGRAVLVLAAVLAALAGCASTKEQENRKLQARAAYEQGVKNLADKRVSIGLASLKQAVELEPDNATYRNALGVVFLDLRRPVEAQAEFEKAVEIDPQFGEAHHNLGLSFAEQGKWEQAIAAYRKALAVPMYATPEVAYHNLGFAYANLGKRKEAEESFRAALQLDPKLLASHFWLGVVLNQEGRKDEAKAHFRAARDLDPGSSLGRAAAEALKTLGDGS